MISKTVRIIPFIDVEGMKNFLLMLQFSLSCDLTQNGLFASNSTVILPDIPSLNGMSLAYRN